MRVGKMSVRWHHTKSHNELHDTETDKTVCQIIDTDKSSIVSEGSSTRYYKDTPCRQKGCKAALAAALLTLDKDERIPYWEEYRLLSKDPTTKEPRPRWGKVAVEAEA